MRKIDCKPGDDLQKFALVHNVGSLLGKQWGKYLLGSLLGNLNLDIAQLTSNYLIIFDIVTAQHNLNLNSIQLK